MHLSLIMYHIIQKIQHPSHNPKILGLASHMSYHIMQIFINCHWSRLSVNSSIRQNIFLPLHIIIKSEQTEHIDASKRINMHYKMQSFSALSGHWTDQPTCLAVELDLLFLYRVYKLKLNDFLWHRFFFFLPMKFSISILV